MNAPRPSAMPAPQRGISLIEILVGVAIGLIGVLAIFQTVAIWDRHTQTTTSGGDAQVAGTLALFNIERDFKQSGHGFGGAPLPVMGCNVNAFDNTGRGAFNFPLRPIDIVVGALGAADTINVVSGNSSFFVEGQDFLSSTPTAKTLRRRGGFKQGDLVVVADAGGGLPGSATCKLGEITDDTDPDMLTVSHAPNGAYTPYGAGAAVASRFDVAQALPAFAFVGGSLFNLGPRPQVVSWQIANNRTLTKTDFLFDSATPVTVADGVINLKAEFFVDVNNNTRVDAGEWLPAIPLGTNWKQVLAVRVALLVRGRQFERGRDSATNAPAAVTLANPTYFNTPVQTFVMTNVDGGADTFTGGGVNTPDPNNWRFYRYRVYERIIPLKNMLWALP